NRKLAHVCTDCSGPLHRIGEDVRKELERVELTVVHEISQAKHGCRKCEIAVICQPPRLFADVTGSRDRDLIEDRANVEPNARRSAKRESGGWREFTVGWLRSATSQAHSAIIEGAAGKTA